MARFVLTMRDLTAASSSLMATKSFLKVMCSLRSASTCTRRCALRALVLLSCISVTAHSLAALPISRSIIFFVPSTASRAPSFWPGALSFAASPIFMKSALYSPSRFCFSSAFASAALIFCSSSALTFLLCAICDSSRNFCTSRPFVIESSADIGIAPAGPSAASSAEGAAAPSPASPSMAPGRGREEAQEAGRRARAQRG